MGIGVSHEDLLILTFNAAFSLQRCRPTPTGGTGGDLPDRLDADGIDAGRRNTDPSPRKSNKLLIYKQINYFKNTI